MQSESQLAAGHLTRIQDAFYRSKKQHSNYCFNIVMLIFGRFSRNRYWFYDAAAMGPWGKGLGWATLRLGIEFVFNTILYCHDICVYTTLCYVYDTNVGTGVGGRTRTNLCSRRTPRTTTNSRELTEEAREDLVEPRPVVPSSDRRPPADDVCFYINTIIT